MCCSWLIVPVNVYFLCLVVLIFHRFLLHSFEILLRRMSSRQYMSDVLPFGVKLILLYSCRNRFCIRQEFLSIVFCIVVCCIYMQALFLGIIGSVLIYSLYCGCFFFITLYNLVRVDIFKWDRFNKIFLVKFFTIIACIIAT